MAGLDGGHAPMRSVSWDATGERYAFTKSEIRKPSSQGEDGFLILVSLSELLLMRSLLGGKLIGKFPMLPRMSHGPNYEEDTDGYKGETKHLP